MSDNNRTEIDVDKPVDSEKYFRATLKDKGYIVVDHTNGNLIAFAQKDINSIHLQEDGLIMLIMNDNYYFVDPKELFDQLKVLK